MKSVQPERNTDLERGFEPLRTAFAVLTLLFGFIACARAENTAAFLEARARDGHPASCIAHDGSEVSRLALRTPDHAIQGRDPHPAGAPDSSRLPLRKGEFP